MVNFIKKLLVDMGAKPKTVQDFLAQYSEDDDIAQLGRDAEELLQNQAFEVAFKRYESYLTGLWRNSTPLQTNERESVWHRLEALHEVRLYLLGLINNMKAEKKIQEEAEKIKKENEDG